MVALLDFVWVVGPPGHCHTRIRGSAYTALPFRPGAMATAWSPAGSPYTTLFSNSTPYTRPPLLQFILTAPYVLETYT